VRNLQQQALCSVIPPHILRHIAEESGADGETRRCVADTLDRMSGLAAKRAGRRRDAHRAAVTGKRRRVYDGQHSQRLPGKLVMSDSGRSSSDVEVQEAWNGAGKTYDFFRAIFDRDSIDGHGQTLDATVHYGKRFDNAFWNGRQMVYGDGDGRVFNRFTVALDVIAHELTHGLTQYTAMLGYTGQNGALNEHLSDAFGLMVKQWALGQLPAESDWIIGEGLFAPSVRGKGLRSMASPGSAYDDPLLGIDPQPAHMRDYVNTTDDNGGVHINSGIPNHAFYLAAVTLGGPAWDAVGRVWFQSLQQLPPDAGFQRFADLTYTTAGKIYGRESVGQVSIGTAWQSVGLIPRDPALGSAQPAVQPRSSQRPPRPAERHAAHDGAHGVKRRA
jgi:Zn-dependent metalloprotease